MKNVTAWIGFVLCLYALAIQKRLNGDLLKQMRDRDRLLDAFLAELIYRESAED